MTYALQVLNERQSMANILDYLDWRGDIPVGIDGFNEVDGLILAELSFIDFSGLGTSPEAREAIPLRAAAESYFAKQGGEDADMGVLVPHMIPELFRRASAYERFRDLRVSGYEEITDEAREEQFAAVTFEIGDGSVFCAFRGTDDTLTGWKEDLNLGFLEAIPSQTQALSYVKRVARRYSDARLRVGGHSKGGNLAIYSAVYAPEDVQTRIERVYNFDGPGFRESLRNIEGHRRIASRILTVMPQSSVVGMILEHESDAVVAHSTAVGLGQHDGFSWEVRGRSFVHLDDFSREGKRAEETLESWTEALSIPQRRAFADAFYEVLTSTGARTLSDLNEDALKNAASMLKTYHDLDDETRHALSGALALLMRYHAKSVAQEMRESQEKGAEELRHKIEEFIGKLVFPSDTGKRK